MTGRISSLAVCGLVAIASPLAAQASPRPSAPAGGTAAEPDLAAVRAATERFRDVNVALAEGYILEPMNICETAEKLGRPAELGVMGVHYFRPDLLGIEGPPDPRVTGTGVHTDFLRPSILIYEPQEDGSMELVAVENLVFVEAWEKAGKTGWPTFRGQRYDLMQDDPETPDVDEGHMFEPHYDLHVWLYRENPNGIFAQFNPNVSCEHHEKATRLRLSKQSG